MRSVIANPQNSILPVKALRFDEQERLVLPGSESLRPQRSLFQGYAREIHGHRVGDCETQEPLELNRRGGRANGPVRISRAEFQKRNGGDPEAISR